MIIQNNSSKCAIHNYVISKMYYYVLPVNHTNTDNDTEFYCTLAAE